MAISLDYFKTHPTDAHTRALMWFGIIASLIVYPIETYIFIVIAQAFNGPYIQGQLAFSGTYMKAYFQSIVNLQAYLIGQIFDYIFMLTYGSLLFSVSVRLARQIPDGTRLSKIAYLMIIFALLAPIFDAGENIMIFFTLSNPVNFPNWWAVLQSDFVVYSQMVLYNCGHLLEYNWANS